MTEALSHSPQAHVDVDVEVGIIIQSLMFRAREQRKELAPVVGVSPSVLGKKLRGQVAFSLTELMRIARHYDVAAGDLMPVVPAGVAIGLPRMDSNHQPCGYASSQVSDGMSDELWGWHLDLYAGEQVQDPGNSWRAWLLDGPALPSRVLGYVELRRLVDRWDGSRGTKVLPTRG